MTRFPGPLAACLLLIFTGVLPARALTKAVEASRPIESGGAVRVDVHYGRLRIVAGEPGQVRVTGKISSELRGLSLGRDAGAVEVRVRFPFLKRVMAMARSLEPTFDVDLLVEVPADTRLFVVSRDADLSIEGIEGPVGVGVVASSVSVRGKPSRLDFEAVSGSLDFEGRTERLDASTLSGALRVVGAEGQVALEAATGELELVSPSLRKASLHTVSGDITVDVSVADGGTVDVETESGEVELTCCAGEGTILDLETKYGEILNEASELEPVRTESGHRRLSFSAGDASGTVRVRTRSGHIWLLPES